MRASGYAREVNDWYVEDRQCVDDLIAAHHFVGDVWDPACGGGNIPQAFELAGRVSYGSDIADRGYGSTGVDFLKTERSPARNIVSNPPYGLLEPFLLHALRLTPNGQVAFITPLAFLESQKRKNLFNTTPLARVLVSRRRISMPPGGGQVKAKNGTVAYAWLIWDHRHTGAPTLGWFG